MISLEPAGGIEPGLMNVLNDFNRLMNRMCRLSAGGIGCRGSQLYPRNGGSTFPGLLISLSFEQRDP